MKYALITMIVLYLLVYGCLPDSSKHDSAEHQDTDHPAVVKTDHGEADHAAGTAESPAEPAAPAGEEQVAVPEPPAAPSKLEIVAEPAEETAAVSEEPASKTAVIAESAVIPVPVAEGTEDELAKSMQKMVDTTNDMVLATRQLVIATQEMLQASKGVAVEVAETGRKAISPEGEESAAVKPEKGVVESLQSVVSATREVLDAVDKALSEADAPAEKQ
jgi:hypothetical protein